MLCSGIIFGEKRVIFTVLMIYAGMNTGIQDSHNLAWKIASVVKGIAPFSILKTYETERRTVLVFIFLLLWHHIFYTMKLSGFLTHGFVYLSQIAVFNTELSIQNFKAAMAVPAALGLDPTIANSGKPKQPISVDLILVP